MEQRLDHDADAGGQAAHVVIQVTALIIEPRERLDLRRLERPPKGALTKTLDEFEASGEEPINSRVEVLSKGKNEIERRVAHLDDCFHILNTVRTDFQELGERRAQIERALAGVETDPAGKTLADRQNALNEFVIQSRLRLRSLQESSATLNLFKEELAKSQAVLVPLQAPVFGIEALIGEVHAVRDLVAKTLSEIEASGDDRLDSLLGKHFATPFETAIAATTAPFFGAPQQIQRTLELSAPNRV